MRRLAAAVTIGLVCGLSLPLATSQAQFRDEVISCRVSESNISLDMTIPLARDGSGNASRGMQGTLDIHHQKMARERRHWNLGDKLPAQFWNWGNDMKVRLLLGTGAQLVDLVIDTQQRPGQQVHTGNFKLETAEGVRVVGRLECQVG